MVSHWKEKDIDQQLVDWAKGQDINNRCQRTIKKDVAFSGRSIVNGKDVRLILRPAEPDSGILFLRRDLSEKNPIKVSFENLARTSIYISLASGVSKKRRLQRFFMKNAHHKWFKFLEHLMIRLPRNNISLIEHILAICYLFLDNLIIEVEDDNVPYLSFCEFFERIKEGEIIEQESPRRIYTLKEPFFFSGKDGQEIRIEPSEELVVDYSIDFSLKCEAVGKQHYSIKITPEAVLKNIAFARSIFFTEWKVFITRIYKKVDYTEANLDMILAADKSGYLNKKENAPRYLRDGRSFELVRHKIGDLLGELSFLEGFLKAKITVKRGGHSFTLLALEKLKNSGLLTLNNE